MRAILAGEEGDLRWDEYVRQQFRHVFVFAVVVAANFLKKYRSSATAALMCERFAVSAGPTRGGDTKGRIARDLLLTTFQEYQARHPRATADDIDALVAQDISDLLSGRLESFLSANVPTKTDLCRCVLANGHPVVTEGYYDFVPRPSCNRATPRPCTIEEFWRARAPTLRHLASAIGEAPDGKLSAMCASASRGVQEFGSLRGRTCHGPFSDAVIMECARAVGRVATTNRRDFEFLIRAAGGGVELVAVGACGQDGASDGDGT